MHRQFLKNETARLSILLLLIVFTAFFMNLGGAPLFDVDEGAFSEATREMLISKNYITTYLNGIPRFDKPVLIYWCQLASVSLFGQNEFAFRLPSALAGALWSFSIFAFMRRETGNRTAFLSAALMALSLQVLVISKAAIADALLNCFIAITMLSLLNHYRTGSKAALIGAFAASGLGMLTKGPIAILIPATASCLFYLQLKELRKWFSLIFNPHGLLIFLIISLPWYILEYQDQGMAFIQGFFFKHNIDRFNTSFEQHSGSIFYYFPVLLIGMMPFTGLLFSVTFRLKTLIGNPTNRFLLIWFCIVFAFFSLSGTKLHHYIIYGYTPMFILMAKSVSPETKTGLLSLWPLLFLIILGSLPLLLPGLAEQAKNGYASSVLRAAAENTGLPFMLLMAVTALIVLAIQFLPRWSVEMKLIGTGTVFALLINLFIFPLAGKLLQEPVKEAALLAGKARYKTVMWKVNYPSFLLYSESLAERRDPLPGEIVLTTADELEKTGKKAVILYSKYGIILAKIMN